ncbi:MAG: hypothetical protein BWY31_03992 [Lentisphaerae bacterium ADurb.Bin242]|nr:MAG: hypothetical protein BWY31_03992 [Lentisphaerae bacterium ADurb.Bin242]
MTLVFFHGFHAVQGIGRAFNKTAGRDGSEVVCGQIRQQREPHVGGRCAVSDDRDRILLIVVGRQPMVFRADEGLKERPRFPGGPAQKPNLCRGQCFTAADKRPAEPPGDCRRRKPEDQDGRRNGQQLRLRQHHCNHCGNGCARRRPHGPVCPGKSAAVIRIVMVERIPFEQFLMRDQHPPGRTKNCIKTEKRFVRQACERKYSKGKLPERRIHDTGQVLTHRYIIGLLKQIQG